ncbi:hypothetical protein LZC95_50320 [Pendulispora brunnea]|uniref:Uncharacterized protein n=1 Tax=Pendulispora brunnea TaxID=2905690 RepID=A0ABZ2K7D4_9BACT
MKVFELIALLERCNRDADIFLMNGENVPFEYEVAGMTTRGAVVALERGDEAEDPDDRRYSEDRWTDRDARLPQTDVFLCEGPQRQCGSRNAWEALVRSGR